MRRSILAAICCLAVAAGSSIRPAAGAEDLPAYRPLAQVSGTIRVWGSPDDGWLIEELEAGFRKYQPAVQFQDTLHGPESTFAAVYMDVADVAFMAREIRVPLETMGFEWVHHYPPFEVEVANAGLGADRGTDRPAVDLAFFVNKANPLSCLTLRQADDILAAEHRRGGADIRRWGELGLTSSWATREIHVYGPAPDSIAALYVRRAVLAGSRKWNRDYRTVAGGWSEVLENVARDPDAIAFAPPAPGNLGAKPLRLAASAKSACYGLSAQTAEAGSYPLLRTVDVALDRRPGTAIEPKVKEFLRFILSREGQRIVVSDDAYLPLSAVSVRQQLERLQ
ncbi:MAG TPA: substrate-binding domain-containing protein [Steroidobacteraceae bacterium]|nr:substrate-binding domain-containing protein [Steroidobacteraceae bacterium]